MTQPHIDDRVAHAVELIRTCQPAVAFTGAGISVESGIPTFRGPGGLWETVDPIFIEIRYFRSNPKESWEKIRDIFYRYFGQAEPNAAHRFLARLEERGLLHAVITQNIDNLHQDAGNTNVVEFHGNSKSLVCTRCGTACAFEPDILDTLPPRCHLCEGILKPDFVFFGEMIPTDALADSDHLVQNCGLLIVIGTTGEVYPAAQLPAIARSNGSRIIEINPDRSMITSLADVHLPLRATEAGDRLIAELGL